MDADSFIFSSSSCFFYLFLLFSFYLPLFSSVVSLLLFSSHLSSFVVFFQINDGMTIHTSGLKIDAGGATVTAGGLSVVDGGATIVSSSASASPLTVHASASSGFSNAALTLKTTRAAHAAYVVFNCFCLFFFFSFLSSDCQLTSI